MGQAAVPTERIILILLIAFVVTALILYVLVRIGQEMLRRFDLWVIQRARYLEETDVRHHRHHHQKGGGGGDSTAARKRKTGGGRRDSLDDSYSGESQSDSD